MAFSFGFANEDIEVDGEEEGGDDMVAPREGVEDDVEMGMESSEDLVQPTLRTLEEMLSTFPSQLAYSSYALHPSLSLPRRTLFDIRAQLMAEDAWPDLPSLPDLTLTNDIRPGLYEGGFKTWECAIDLARFLAQGIQNDVFLPRHRDVHVIELGAGTALPSTYLLSTILGTSRSSAGRLGSPRSVTFTLCDYNPDVLSHASIPNLLLAFAAQHPDLQPFPDDDALEIPDALKTALTTDLASTTTTVNGVGGAWGRTFDEIVKGAWAGKARSPSMGTAARRPRHALVLASETLYSPKTLPIFTNTLMALLEPSPMPTQPWPGSSTALRGEGREQVRDSSTALVASKKVYFGVGGGVDEFVVLVEKAGGWARLVWDSEWGEGEDAGWGDTRGGVGRCILEVGRRE